MKNQARLAIIVGALAFLVCSGCVSDGSSAAIQQSLTDWVPPMPQSPPPVLGMKQMIGFEPPRYPDHELREGIRGEVLIEIVIGDGGSVSGLKILRTTTPGYAQSVLDSFAHSVTLKGLAPGTYCWSFLFYGDDDRYQQMNRPGTFFVGHESFSR